MPVPKQFDGPARGELRDALVDAFPGPFVFGAVLSDRLNRVFLNYVPAYLAYPLQLNDLLQRANAEAWIAELVSAALSAVPDNPALLRFAEKHGFTAVTAVEREDAHQRMVQAGVEYLDSNLWRIRLGELEAQVCRVEVRLDQGGTTFGTGFLVGPSVLMTNYHVLEPVYLGVQGLTTAKGYSAKPQNVTVRFDYKEVAEGVLNRGVTYTLDANWDLDKSQTFSPVDGDAPADCLDYGLVRLSEAAGSDTAGKKGAASGKPRGFLSPRAPYGFAVDSPIFILQHPKSLPLKLVLSTNGVVKVTGGGTRVRYRTNTEVGSSGSPVFTQKWELVALHHAGDPEFEHDANWNQGIPFAAILALMNQRGTAVHLGT